MEGVGNAGPGRVEKQWQIRLYCGHTHCFFSKQGIPLLQKQDFIVMDQFALSMYGKVIGSAPNNYLVKI